MPIPAQQVQGMIELAIPDAQVRLESLVNDDNHYVVYVTSPAFKGKTRIAQHKMVYDALDGKMGNELHALSVRTSVPE